MGYGYGYHFPDYDEPETKELSVDEFTKIWPSSKWPDKAQSFKSAVQKGDLIEVLFFARHGIISHTFTIKEESSRPHRCEPVNVSFNFVIMACKICGKSQ